MQVKLNINEMIVQELFTIFKTNDLNSTVNSLLTDYVSSRKKKIDDFFGKVDYFEDYDYKSLRQRVESIS